MQQEIDLGSLFIELTCTAPLDDSDFTTRHCRHYQGRVFAEPNQGENEEVATFSFYDFDVTLHASPMEPGDNERAFMVMDAQSQDTLDAFEAILDNIHQVADAGWLTRIVYLSRLVVHPPYRGEGIARWWLAWVLNHVSFGDETSTCVAATPFPIGDDGEPMRKEKVLPEARADIEDRRKRLIALYESAGFKQLGDTGVWGLGLAFERPDPRAR